MLHMEIQKRKQDLAEGLQGLNTLKNDCWGGEKRTICRHLPCVKTKALIVISFISVFISVYSTGFTDVILD